MEAANEAARRAVNGILKAAGSSAPQCGVWQLHEPELFAPWRELDYIAYKQDLPWNDALVQLGLSFTELADKALQALESGSEEHTLTSQKASGLPLPHQALLQFADREAQAGVMSDLRRDAMTLIERVVRLMAMRMVESHGTRIGVTSSSTQGRTGRVAIIPK
jgi:hypothetical protein